MKRKGRKITTWMVAGILISSTFSAGCEPSGWFGSNFSMNVVVPLGLAGTPGLLNPFGIVQAWVNAWVAGSQASDTTTTDDTESPLVVPSPSAPVDPSIAVVVG